MSSAYVNARRVPLSLESFSHGNRLRGSCLMPYGAHGAGLRHPHTAPPEQPPDPAFRLSVGLGLVLTFFLTVAVAGYMVNNGGHFVGSQSTVAPGAPLMGWARDRGDLRVAHFFATHAMHFVPAFGFVV